MEKRREREREGREKRGIVGGGWRILRASSATATAGPGMRYGKPGERGDEISVPEKINAAALSTANLRDNKAITGDCVAVGCDEKDLRVG